MAVGTGHGHVAARQLEPRLLMLGKREGRRTVTLERVALIALVLVRLRRELAVVLVFVAIGAALEIHDLEDRLFAFRRVTLLALQLGVSVDQRVVRLGVRLDVEQRRLPSLHVVTAGTLDAVRLTFRKLTVVLVLVAVSTFCKREFLLEVAIRVAASAVHGGMLAQQGILGLRVIEGAV